MEIFCLIVAEREGSFSVRVDESDLVHCLKEAIKLENDDITAPLRKLQLFHTNENGGWLSSTAPDVIAMRNGTVPAGLKDLMNVEMDSAALIGDVFKGAPTNDTIHVATGTEQASEDHMEEDDNAGSGRNHLALCQR
ncbi:Hypothetical protein PHPALM_6889 [Phytophthora palmivora]|uniref:Crinkler effector protein N-terminal domain-containing protein n=1 Tax=Phytophthora palmivora TaxID=4796 RepID=A0A2P4YDQ1_9STRA|nr:Hypothetical protein PHPALM_6889 [Phytophthora palmivora]